MLALIKILFIFTLQFGNNETKAPFVCTAFCPIPGQPDCLCTHSGFFFMKEIQLTQGKVAIVDDEDFEYLNQWKWHAIKSINTYYAVRCSWINGKDHTRIMHRIIMNNPINKSIDHINHNGLDNRKENLRICTCRENSINRLKPNPTGYCGVSKHGRKFRSRIWINGKICTIGTFLTAELAGNAYTQKLNQL
jgi:hypothetical protein